MVSGEGSVSSNSPAGLGLGQLLGTLLVPQLCWGTRHELLLHLQPLSFLLLFSISRSPLLNFFCPECPCSEFLAGSECGLSGRESALVGWEKGVVRVLWTAL